MSLVICSTACRQVICCKLDAVFGVQYATPAGKGQAGFAIVHVVAHISRERQLPSCGVDENNARGNMQLAPRKPPSNEPRLVAQHMLQQYCQHRMGGLLSTAQELQQSRPVLQSSTCFDLGVTAPKQRNKMTRTEFERHILAVQRDTAAVLHLPISSSSNCSLASAGCTKLAHHERHLHPLC